MAQVIFRGWREGLDKVLLTKLQMSMLNTTLKKAKSNVDSLLEGETIVIMIDSLVIAQEFVEEANKIGVNCSIKEVL